MKSESKKSTKIIFAVVLSIVAILGLCYCAVVAYVFAAYETSTEMENYRNMKEK